MSRCEKCRLTPGYVEGPPVVRDGKIYPTMDPCPACRPRIPEPSNVDPARANNPDRKNLRDDAEKWIESHQLESKLLLKFARELASRGRRFGVKLLTERLRWECEVEGLRWNDYRVNNNLTAYLARWLVGQDASLEKYIKFREVRY